MPESGFWSLESGSEAAAARPTISERQLAQSRTAPVSAEPTSLAYLARAPLVYLGAIGFHALTRSDPASCIDIINGAWSTPLDPRISPEDRAIGNFTSSRAVIDACRPYHWRDEFPKVNAPTPEAARKARQRFGWLLDGKNRT